MCFHFHFLGEDANRHLEFRRQVALVAMKVGVTDHRGRKGSPSASVPACIGKPEYSHFFLTNTQGRYCICKNNTKKVSELSGKRMHAFQLSTEDFMTLLLNR